MNRTTWEYRTVKHPATGGFLGGKFDETQLDVRPNDLGVQGWELVSAVHISGNKVTLIARRPMSSDERRRRSYPT